MIFKSLTSGLEKLKEKQIQMRINSINNNNNKNTSFGLLKVPELSTLSGNCQGIVKEVLERFSPKRPFWQVDDTVMVFRSPNHESIATDIFKKAKITFAKIEDRFLEDPAMRKVIVSDIRVINGNPEVQIDSRLLEDLAINDFYHNHIDLVV
jgi:hypothetical protein